MEVKITPTNVVVDAGQQVTLAAQVDDEPENARYLWTRDGAPVATNGNTLTIDRAQPEDAGRYSVLVVAGGQEASSAPAIVAVRASTPEWDDSFAAAAALALIVVLVLIALPLVVALYRLADAADLNRGFAALVAIALVLIGAFAFAAASYAPLLETRGRARRRQRRVILTTRAPSRPDDARRRALAVPAAVGKAIEAIPATLTAFGKLSGYAALLAVTALLFIAGAALAWRESDATGGGTATGTTVTTTTTLTTTTTTTGG